MEIRFTFLCEKKWDDLIGSDLVRRHCSTCDREITNLDSLTERERRKLFAGARRAGVKPCVFLTAPGDEDSDGRPFPVPTGGEPEMPDEDNTGLDDLLDDDWEPNFV